MVSYWYYFINIIFAIYYLALTIKIVLRVPLCGILNTIVLD